MFVNTSLTNEMELLIGFLPSNVAPNFYDQWKDICVSCSFDYFWSEVSVEVPSVGQVKNPGAGGSLIIVS